MNAHENPPAFAEPPPIRATEPAALADGAPAGPVPPVLDAEPAPAGPPVPVQPGERIEVMDIVRGFALLGILAVNMELFNTPMMAVGIGEGPRGGINDAIAKFLIGFFAAGKFYSTFAFLFGL